MNDPRYAELAKLLVEYSCGLKKGESVFIDVSDIPDRMTIALIRAVRKVRAIPLVETRQSRVLRELVFENDPGRGTVPDEKSAGVYCYSRR